MLELGKLSGSGEGDDYLAVFTVLEYGRLCGAFNVIFVGDRGRAGVGIEKKREKVAICYFTTQRQQRWDGWSEDRSQELGPGLPREWQELSHLGRPCASQEGRFSKLKSGKKPRNLDTGWEYLGCQVSVWPSVLFI